jgi:hypothetical protein
VGRFDLPSCDRTVGSVYLRVVGRSGWSIVSGRKVVSTRQWRDGWLCPPDGCGRVGSVYLQWDGWLGLPDSDGKVGLVSLTVVGKLCLTGCGGKVGSVFMAMVGRLALST